MARRSRRRVEKAKRHAPSAPRHTSSPTTRVRVATDVPRLVYTRKQAAQALGVSRTTFDRRVLPLLETADMPWGTRYIPVDELERFVVERRKPVPGRPPAAPPGRPTVVPDELVHHIQLEHAKGKSLRQIARDLNDSRMPTAHGGAQWWPSTVRAVLVRSSPAKSVRANSANLSS
jgi:Recombinase